MLREDRYGGRGTKSVYDFVFCTRSKQYRIKREEWSFVSVVRPFPLDTRVSQKRQED